MEVYIIRSFSIATVQYRPTPITSAKTKSSNETLIDHY